MTVAALLIGVAAGLPMGLAAGTRRTESAPDRYTASSGGDPDLVLHQQNGPPLTDDIAQLNGVASASSVAFVTSFLMAPGEDEMVFEENPFAGSDRFLGARVVEGRFAEPTAPDEFTINRPFAELLQQRFGTRVGDRFEVVSFDQAQTTANAFDSGEPPAVPAFEATLVGITESPTDFDNPAPNMVFPSAFLAAHPTVGIVQTEIAVYLSPGADRDAIIGAVRALPNGSDAFPVDLRIVSADARRAVRFQVTALWIVAVVSVLAAVVVIAQIAARLLGIGADERSSLMAIGWRRHHLMAERAVVGGLVALLAAPVAAVVAYFATALFPFGALRMFEPTNGPRVDWAVTFVGLIAAFALVVIVAIVVARQITRQPTESGRRVLAGLMVATGASVALTTGSKFATSSARGGRRSVMSFVAGAVGLAGIVASLVVWSSLTKIVDQPDRWGVNFDQLFGNPYVPTESDIVAPVIDNPDLVAVTAASIGSLTINGHDTSTFAFDAVKGGLRPTVIDGREPASDSEIGLGAEVARRLHVGVGDEVDAVGSEGSGRRVRVVGIVVTPDSAGNGAAMTFDGYAVLNPTATKNVMIARFREGAPADVAAAVAAANFSPPGTLVTPTSVRALQRVTAAPFLLAVVLVVLLTVACAYLLATSVRARWHDLAVLRALGSDRRQLRAIVHWQAVVISAIAIVFGLPSGIVFGRLIVQLLTDTLGIVPGARVAPGEVGVVPLLALAVVNLLALVPARRAAHTDVARLTLDR